jgi:Ca2+-transporting ATPase
MIGMPGKVIQLENIKGLSSDQVNLLQKQYGRNRLKVGPEHRIIRILLNIASEPMFILLSIACSLYFILGSNSEGIIMAVAILFVTAISLFQEIKSSRAIQSLKQFVQPGVTVIRDGREQQISVEDLVPGDVMLLEEGMKVPADAIILQANDLSLNEAVITGESLPADKYEEEGHNQLYQGTLINSGKCIACVTATGNYTLLGKIGKEVAGYNPPKTRLQLQINKFVRMLFLFGLVAFCIIFFVNYLHYEQFTTSLLFALTLAMSAVPEEIPVAFSSFMALGAYKMSKLGIISRQPQIIENLGAVSVICLDKTGTITENKMKLKTIYDFEEDTLIDAGYDSVLKNKDILQFGMLASESNPFDPMEKAIWEAYNLHTPANEQVSMKMVYEYPLEGRPPMMTHVYQGDSMKIIAAKGAAERIMAACRLDTHTASKITNYVQTLAAKGYRVIGVAAGFHQETELPPSQDDFKWQFKGLLALHDPLKKNIPDVFKKIGDAGIDIKLLTGDYPETAIHIAGEAGILNPLRCIKGEDVLGMKEDQLRETVKQTFVFARMFPDAKLKVINALKANGEIVAMTGDGVNDAPALKAADIGIAMGSRGTETAKQVSELVLTDDNLEKIVSAVREGRKIYSNLVKAVRYIIAIHIPIILTASLPVILGWTYPNIFTPVHVIFLELIMGPTCSIFFEREPVEDSIMLAAPRNTKEGLFAFDELLISVVQGLFITAGVLSLYYYFMDQEHRIEVTRNIVFTTLILCNVFLTFASRSFTRTMYHTSRYPNNLAPWIVLVSATFLFLLHFVPAVRNLFALAPISLYQFFWCFIIAFASVMWFEVYKMIFMKQKGH